MVDMASACLVGVKCRYDGTDRTDLNLKNRFLLGEIVPFCPEILGGLTTPRPRIRFEKGSADDLLDGVNCAVNENGDDPEKLSDALRRGARKSCAMAKVLAPDRIFLKSKSPSCGCGGAGVKGVTAALLEREGHTLVEVDGR